MKVARVPVGKFYVQLQKASSWVSSSTAPPRRLGVWSKEALGRVFFFFNYYYLSNGESIEILVSPFLLFVTNSHGSVFSVLFFFSVFFKKKNSFSPPGGRNWPFK